MARAASDSTFKSTPAVGGHELLVTGDGGVWHVLLPPQGELLIGRAPEAEIRLDGNSVSRRHAVFRVHEAGFAVRDLGSANGTILRGQPAPSEVEVALVPGEAFSVGEFLLVLRTRRAASSTRHIWSSEYFEARVGEQCERSRAEGGTAFFLIGVGVEPKPAVEPTAVIAAELAAADVLGRLAADRWAVLLVDDSALEAEALALRLERALGERGCRARTRLIGCPRDGTSSSALMARLSQRAELGAEAASTSNVVLRSPAMVAIYEQVDAVARGGISVLILGETGVGKDVLARSIHERSERAGKPFLRLNCAALAEPLLESELFGHEKGSFTGALTSKTGLLQSAAGGTVFLDEIGEFPQRLQPKLLQVLESREILSVGSVKPRSVDVRFVAATNRDLEAEALSGDFRSDLYYRLAGFTFIIPPLRERREDILPLALEFLRKLCLDQGRSSPVRIRDDAAIHLLDYAWPGNVRELRNVMERALVLCDGQSIGPEHLPLDKMRSVVLVSQPKPSASNQRDTELPVADLSAEELAERQRILDVLAECAGNQSQAAEVLGISRSTLVNRLNTYRIRRPRKRPR
ncbi:MAG TPA: sigma 54-interacting transcriptional regulator [Polyangiaceae bacterium]|nr:sigma 54-interacting transcriptional regulator [Polyangiaceae bacterium]